MEQTLTRTSLALENIRYRGTGGVSENNRQLSFQPAFIDRATRKVYLSRFPDGRLAPCHLLDGLPPEVVLGRSERGSVTSIKPSVVSGFVRDGHFYTRDEAAAVLVSVAETSATQAEDSYLRRAA